MKHFLWLLLFLLLVSLPADGRSEERPTKPELFYMLDIWSGGGSGGSTLIELKGKTLVRTVTRSYGVPDKITTITPTAKQWRELRAALNRVGFWGWKERYRSDEITNAPYSWRLHVVYADRANSSSGETALPPGSIDPIIKKLFAEAE